MDINQPNFGKRVYGSSIQSPPGRAQFVNVASPDTKMAQGKQAKYKLHLLMPKQSTDLTELSTAVLNVAVSHADQNGLPVPRELKDFAHPFRDGDSKGDKGYEGFADSWFIIPTSFNQPQCLGPDGRTLIDPSTIYPGALIRCYITPASFTDQLKVQDPSTGMPKTITRAGVTFYLELVQFLEDRPRFMNRPSANPTDVFSSWGNAGQAAPHGAPSAPSAPVQQFAPSAPVQQFAPSAPVQQAVAAPSQQVTGAPKRLSNML